MSARVCADSAALPIVPSGPVLPIVTIPRLTGLLLLLLAIGFASFAQAPPVRDPIRVQTVLVIVPVAVTDARGKYVPGLQAGDFRLYQDGAPQQFAVFAASEEPIHVALLLDTSKSTVTVLDNIRKAAISFVRHLRPQDQAMIVTFDHEIRVMRSFTVDHAALEEVLRGVKVGEYVGTKMRDAIVELTEGRFRLVQGRKAIVLLSDGQDFGSSTLPSDLLARIAESGTLIYAVFYRVDPREVMKKLFGVSSRMPRRRQASAGSDPGRPAASPRAGAGQTWEDREKEAARFLEQMSEVSAGRFYRSELTDIKTAFAQITEELRHQYLLGFYPDKSKLDGNLHSLSIDVGRPGLVVRGRRNYRVLR